MIEAVTAGEQTEARGQARLTERLAAGDARALARAVSLVEDGAPEAAGLLAWCEGVAAGRLERAWRIGLTGPPGAGKSTLLDGLIRAFRVEGHSVGVIAVDPSSSITGGALLGDRIRLGGTQGDGFSGDQGVFVRSMASRGELGGLPAQAAAVCSVMEAAGRERLLLETVGVGQDEVAVAGLAEITVLVLMPGMGDDVQSLKAGVMEIADIFVVNKSDQPGGERVEQEIRAMQSLACDEGAWIAPVVRTVASTGEGLAALMTEVARCVAWKRAAGMRPKAAIKAATQLGLGKVMLDHLGVAVHSLSAACSFYQLLGLRPGHVEVIAEEGVRVTMLPLGESRLELLEAMTADSNVGRFLEQRGEGLHHVALRVSGLDEHFERLRAAGVRLASESIQVGAGGQRCFLIHPGSTGGVLLELVGA